MAAIVLAHDRALVMKAGRRSQHAMLAVMVGFTVLALWLLSRGLEGLKQPRGREPAASRRRRSPRSRTKNTLPSDLGLRGRFLPVAAPCAGGVVRNDNSDLSFRTHPTQCANSIAGCCCSHGQARAARRLTSAAGTTRAARPAGRARCPRPARRARTGRRPRSAATAPARSPISCRTRPAHGPPRSSKASRAEASGWAPTLRIATASAASSDTTACARAVDRSAGTNQKPSQNAFTSARRSGSWRRA